MTRAPVLAALIFLLAACADNNPIEWGTSAARGIGDMFGGDTPPEAEPPAAEGRPYPNLATVPRRPRDPPEVKAQRQADVERLTRDRDKALADDQALRETGAMPPPAPDVAGEAPKESAQAVAPAPTASPSNVAVVPSPSPAPASSSPVAAAVAAPAQRVGSVSFARDAATLTAAAQQSLAEAATLARPGNGRVRLVPAQTARQAASVDLARARLNAVTQALAAAGIPAARLTVEEALGRRVDLYDVYVER